MGDVSEHYPEQEGEGYYGEYCRVYFFVHWDSVRVHDLLESVQEFVGVYFSGRSHASFTSHLDSLQSFESEGVLNFMDLVLSFWVAEVTPEKSMEKLIFWNELVHSFIDQYFLPCIHFVYFKRVTIAFLYFIHSHEVVFNFYSSLLK